MGIQIAMLFGAGERERLTKAIYNSFYVLTGAAMLITLTGFWGRNIFWVLWIRRRE